MVAPIGKRYSYAIVLSETNRGTSGRFRVKAICDCGIEFECELRHLERGSQKSCGCSKIKHGLDSHPLSPIWRSMKARCDSPKAIMYPVYGGRGIGYCEEWSDLTEFVKWAEGAGYKKGLQIDRIDNDEGYYPENCRWVSAKQQQRNRRNNRKVEYGGELITIAELAEISRQPYDRIYQRIFKLGWTPEEAAK